MRLIDWQCKQGELAVVARSTMRLDCVNRLHGTLISCSHPIDTPIGGVWALRKPIECPRCGLPLFAFLDADLDPISAPASGQTGD